MINEERRERRRLSPLTYNIVQLHQKFTILLFVLFSEVVEKTIQINIYSKLPGFFTSSIAHTHAFVIFVEKKKKNFLYSPSTRVLSRVSTMFVHWIDIFVETYHTELAKKRILLFGRMVGKQKILLNLKWRPLKSHRVVTHIPYLGSLSQN